MQSQGPIFVGLPHLGPILFWLFTRYSVTDWCKGLRTLSWCPPYKTVLLVWTTIYSLMGRCYICFCSTGWW
uniref:Translocator protein 2 n=1 Tax=Chinchilla lanigera TaxID=34839 RepID=A0A8C2VRQ4_CHILA